jgi:pimeloyl-ACP methyl ester carboxylesterase
VALGYDRIDLLSESAGTRYAMVYSWRYPKSIHRSVMIAVNPPGHFLWDAKTTDEQIARYADLCSKDADCSKRTDDLAAVMSGTKIPKRWGFLPIKEGQRPDRLLLRSHGVDLGGGALLPDHAELVALRRRR